MVLIKPYPPRTPLLAGAGNVPWSAWLSELVRAVNTLITGTRVGAGDPNGQLVGDVGDTYRRTDGGAGSSFYVKESGAGLSSGWVAK